MVALVLADEALRKFGGDSVAELVRNHGTYAEQVREQTARIDTVVGAEAEAAPLNWDESQAFEGADPNPSPARPPPPTGPDPAREPAGAPSSGARRARRDDGRRARPRSGDGWPHASGARSSTPTPRSRPAPAARSGPSSRPRASPLPRRRGRGAGRRPRRRRADRRRRRRRRGARPGQPPCSCATPARSCGSRRPSVVLVDRVAPGSTGRLVEADPRARSRGWRTSARRSTPRWPTWWSTSLAARSPRSSARAARGRGATGGRAR